MGPAWGRPGFGRTRCLTRQAKDGRLRDADRKLDPARLRLDISLLGK